MSRSYKKHQIRWLCCNSEKYDKKMWHRSFRREFNQLLHVGEDENFPHPNLHYDCWSSSSDGKYMPDQKTINEYYEMNPEWIRKRYRKINGVWHMMK